MQRALAIMPLDTGHVPRWLFERMVKLTRMIVIEMVSEYGPDEFIKRISDPVWFQSLSCVIGMDWNSSGTTTITTGALKQALRGLEKDLGIFICGGKGRTSRKTPEEIQNWAGVLGLPSSSAESLVYNSRMSAKVDSALVQDGYQIYHHNFFFSKNGAWAVIQQGMNTMTQTARRYHWYSEEITDIILEPHSGIVSQRRVPTLNLVAKKSQNVQKMSVALIQGGYKGLMKDVRILRRHISKLSQTITIGFRGERSTILKLENRDFFWHPVLLEDLSKSRYLERILAHLCERKPANYEALLSERGVGPKTIRALTLISELIYGAQVSYEDPARYCFAHGGKDNIPYPIDRLTYDASIDFFQRVIQKTKIPFSEKRRMLQRIRRKNDPGEYER